MREDTHTGEREREREREEKKEGGLKFNSRVKEMHQ
jgi:hypothetical protein